MKHDYIVEGFAYRLRPVVLQDAELILDIRLHDLERNKYINPISPDPEKQRKWLKRYFDVEGDWYFVIENMRSNEDEGLISVYEFDADKNEAEWGRWVTRAESMCATESAYLIYEFAFTHLELDRLYANTLVNNETVVSFHDSFGAERAGIVKDYASINDEFYAAQTHEITSDRWPELKEKHSKICQMIARKV